jgi:hypothetical protein
LGGLLPENQPMIRTALVAVAAAAVTASTFAVTTANAGARRDQQSYVYNSSPSLDGRVTGRARTCGYNTFIYDGRGVPRGPYCH